MVAKEATQGVDRTSPTAVEVAIAAAATEILGATTVIRGNVPNA